MGAFTAVTYSGYKLVQSIVAGRCICPACGEKVQSAKNARKLDDAEALELLRSIARQQADRQEKEDTAGL